MKNFDTRVYNVSDFLQWRDSEQLDLSPDFQRRTVWSEKAKSYLVDTILRGKPMPKIIITQELRDRKNVRVVVDGQQRLRAIIGYIDGDFKISRAHNKKYANLSYDGLPDEIKNDLLKYEIGVDLLYDIPYSEILDIFARINTYTVKLNKQETLNAKYLGYFKQYSYELGYKYVNFFLDSNIISKTSITRMGEAELASDMLVALVGGIQTNKNIEKYYNEYEDDSNGIEKSVRLFDKTMSYIGEVYSPAELSTTNWSRIQLFYSMFLALSHGIHGVKGLRVKRPTINNKNISKIRSRLDEISSRYDLYTSKDDEQKIPKDYKDFIDYSRRGTTDSTARIYRTSFICKKLNIS